MLHRGTCCGFDFGQLVFEAVDLAIEIVKPFRQFPEFGLACKPAMGGIFTSGGRDHQSVVSVKSFSAVGDESSPGELVGGQAMRGFQ